MTQFICSHPLIPFAQGLLALVGTWTLAFGLKSVQESRGFDTSKPHPMSYRFWVGLALISLAALPSLFGPLVCVAPAEAKTVDLPMAIDLFVGIAMVSLTAALVGATFRYAKATDRILDEMRRQDRPVLYVFYENIREGTGREPFYQLLLRNVGSRMAHDIRLEVVQDAFIGADLSEGKQDFVRVSQTTPFRDGIRSLLPGDKVLIGYYSRGNFSERRSDQNLAYRLTYKDGAGLSYQEVATIKYKIS